MRCDLVEDLQRGLTTPFYLIDCRLNYGEAGFHLLSLILSLKPLEARERHILSLNELLDCCQLCRDNRHDMARDCSRFRG